MQTILIHKATKKYILICIGKIGEKSALLFMGTDVSKDDTWVIILRHRKQSRKGVISKSIGPAGVSTNDSFSSQDAMIILRNKKLHI